LTEKFSSFSDGKITEKTETLYRCHKVTTKVKYYYYKYYSHLCWSVKVQHSDELFVGHLSTLCIVNYVKNIVQLRLGCGKLCNNNSSSKYYYNSYYNYNYYRQSVSRLCY